MKPVVTYKYSLLTSGFQHIFLILFTFTQQMVQALYPLHTAPHSATPLETLSLVCYEDFPWLLVSPTHAHPCLSVWPSSLLYSLGLCSNKSSWFHSLPRCTVLGVRVFETCGRDCYLLTKYPELSGSTQAATGPAKGSDSQPPLELQIARRRWAQVS